ncbi:lipopolysaccharide heptosyltransferase II [Candidatus Omnitrophota bacterium]
MEIKRILIVNVNWRGDVLFTTPFIRALRKKFPDSYIATLVVPRCAALLELNPHLNEIIIFDEEGQHSGLRGKLELVKALKSKSFDTAFLLHRSTTRAFICWLAGIPQRIGYYTRKRSLLLTKSIPVPRPDLHKVDYFLNIASSLAIDAEDKSYEFYFSREDQDYVQRLLAQKGINSNDFSVIINPGGNWAPKRWPEEYFIHLADRLIEKHQAKIIITGADSDLKLAEDIAGQLKGEAVVLSGQTTLGQLAALMSQVKLVIANDSGPMHIAVSQGAKVIALFGPTSAKITGPYGKGNYTVIQKDIGCRIPCYQPDCDRKQCLREISVDDVLQAVEKVTVNG